MSTIAKTNMGTPLFHEFKKQASFFVKEKIKNARLALTDVTPAELLAEDATSGNLSPDTKTLGTISRAAFEVDDYWRIVEILHKRLSRFDRKNWRVSYNSLLVLEHLLTHGPESAAEEFQGEKDVIREMQSFQHIDEKGFNWGLAVRKKSERILKLLEKGPVLKEERDKARKLSRGIQGFGSFCHRSLSIQSAFDDSSVGVMGRCNSAFNDHGNQENQPSPLPNKLNELESSADDHNENVNHNTEDLQDWTFTEDSDPLLSDQMAKPKTALLAENDHPFNDTEHQNNAPLLSGRDEIVQGC